MSISCKYKDSCSLHGQFRNFIAACTKDYNAFTQDYESYGFGWQTFSPTYVPPNGFQSIYDSFQFQTSENLQGLPLVGLHNTYEGNGYVYEMRGSLSYLRGNLSLLEAMSWIDEHTRAVFIEFASYNANINLLMVSTILVEFLPAGSVLTSFRFDPLNLFNDLAANVALKTVLALLVFAFVGYFMLQEVRHLVT